MKGKMILNYSLLAVLCLGSVGLTSCKRRKEPTLQAYQNINLHIAQFSISKEVKEQNSEGKEVTKLDPNISSTFFSIDNRQEEGLISNMKPLPYGTKLTDVKLNLIPAIKTAKVELSLDAGKTFTEWKEENKTNFTLTDSKNQIRIRLSYKEKANSEHYTYTYKVEINTYKFDPSTIHWAKLNTATTDVLANKVAFDTYTLDGDKMMLMTADKGSKTNKFYILNTGNNTFEEVSYPTLANGVFIKNIKNYKNNVYALASDNKLYELSSNKTWIDLKQEAEALLGVFAPRKEGAKPSLALIVQDNNKSYFAHYENTDSKLEKGEELMSNFPKQSYQTLSGQKKEVGAILTLLGAEGLIYQTTNATAWALPYGEKVLSTQDKEAFAFTKNGDLFYCFTATDEGLSIYTKSTLQTAWVKNGKAALESKDGQTFDAKKFGNCPIALWVKGEDFYLYKGGVEAQLYKGELKKDAI